MAARAKPVSLRKKLEALRRKQDAELERTADQPLSEKAKKDVAILSAKSR